MLVTFWKSNFKQQLGCRFDIMDNVSFLCFDKCNYICLEPFRMIKDTSCSVLNISQYMPNAPKMMARVIFFIIFNQTLPETYKPPFCFQFSGHVYILSYAHAYQFMSIKAVRHQRNMYLHVYFYENWYTEIADALAYHIANIEWKLCHRQLDL